MAGLTARCSGDIIGAKSNDRWIAHRELKWDIPVIASAAYSGKLIAISLNYRKEGRRGELIGRNLCLR